MDEPLPPSCEHPAPLPSAALPPLGLAVGVAQTLAYCSTVRPGTAVPGEGTRRPCPSPCWTVHPLCCSQGREYPLQLSFSSLTSLPKTLLFIFLVSFPVLYEPPTHNQWPLVYSEAYNFLQWFSHMFSYVPSCIWPLWS